MKKLAALLLALLLVLGCCSAFAEGDEITLDVIICQYGPNTQDWFLGTGMDGTNFVEKFEALRCQDLLQKQFAPDERTPAAVAMGITGHCSVMIVTAVEIIEAMLEEQNENR